MINPRHIDEYKKKIPRKGASKEAYRHLLSFLMPEDCDTVRKLMLNDPALQPQSGSSRKITRRSCRGGVKT